MRAEAASVTVREALIAWSQAARWPEPRRADGEAIVGCRRERCCLAASEGWVVGRGASAAGVSAPGDGANPQAGVEEVVPVMSVMREQLWMVRLSLISIRSRRET